jgi:hypothetical protein
MRLLLPRGIRRLRTLNETSTKPVGYAERFVKRHGLFSLLMANGPAPRERADQGAVDGLCGLVA